MKQQEYRIRTLKFMNSTWALGWKLVQGAPVACKSLPGISLFARQSGGYWLISDVLTGFRIPCRPRKTLKASLGELRRFLQDQDITIEKYKQHQRKALKEIAGHKSREK